MALNVSGIVQLTENIVRRSEESPALHCNPHSLQIIRLDDVKQRGFHLRGSPAKIFSTRVGHIYGLCAVSCLTRAVISDD
jgi:hypothetical protein